MPLPGEAPPTSNELSNQQLSHLDTPMHLHMSCKTSRKSLILHPVSDEATSYTCVGYSILLNTLHINIFHLCTHGKSDNILHIMRFVSLHVHKVTILGLLTFQMAVWSFRDALVELEVKNCFDESML